MMCAIAIVVVVVLALLHEVFVQIKAENNGISGISKNLTMLVNKGVANDRLGNHTGAIEYYDKALSINPKG